MRILASFVFELHLCDWEECKQQRWYRKAEEDMIEDDTAAVIKLHLGFVRS